MKFLQRLTLHPRVDIRVIVPDQRTLVYSQEHYHPFLSCLDFSGFYDSSPIHSRKLPPSTPGKGTTSVTSHTRSPGFIIPSSSTDSNLSNFAGHYNHFARTTLEGPLLPTLRKWYQTCSKVDTPAKTTERSASQFQRQRPIVFGSRRVARIFLGLALRFTTCKTASNVQ